MSISTLQNMQNLIGRIQAKIVYLASLRAGAGISDNGGCFIDVSIILWRHKKLGELFWSPHLSDVINSIFIPLCNEQILMISLCISKVITKKLALGKVLEGLKPHYLHAFIFISNTNFWLSFIVP